MTSTGNTLTPSQVKAGRALLAWSQQELAAAANVSTSTIADFERAFRTPVANNAQAIREALEAKGLQFIAGGVVARDKMPVPPSARPGAIMRWITATHLSQWGERRDGQSGMPELLRRLIYASVGPAASVRFPSDESVQYPGWDGICASSTGSSFVPEGESVWEIGAQRTSIAAKATEDFDKRTADPLGRDRAKTTFVFVTPQRFVGKDRWVAEKRALKLWRDVVAIDGDDLAHWLEGHPAVAQWLSAKIGRRPKGLRNLEEVWAEWSRATQPPLTADILLTSREDQQAAIWKWLAGPAVLHAIQAESPEEAMAFLHAALSPLPEPHRLAYWSRCVVADDIETARELIGVGAPLIIVLPNPDPGLVQRLSEDGHHVFAAYGPTAAGAAGAPRLPRPWKYDLQRALTRSGLAEEEAHRLAHSCGRSVTVLRRLMPAAPHSTASWAHNVPPELIAAMLAGAWSVKDKVRDRKVIAGLAGCPYEQVETVLAPLAGRLDGPLVRLGQIWKAVSLRDLWLQIGAQLTPSQFARFEAVFQKVLGEVNPRYDRAPKSPYYEEEGEFGEECTRALRRGLTEAMIAMAVYPDRAVLIPDLAGRVEQAVRRLLRDAAPGLWWSLSSDFHNLAEAAPNAFLEALEAGLEGEDAPVKALFRSDEGMLAPQEYLADLLWALEMLARSREYVTRAALVLAHLDEIDPGGKMGNRPSASLRRIFVSWSPQTYATPAQRLKVIDRILRDYPSGGWRLLVALAPRHHDVSEPSSKPNWRDFSPDEPEVVTWSSVAAANREIGKRLLLNVGQDIERWSAILDCWANFEPDWRRTAGDQLEAFAKGLTDAGVIEALRDKLRGLIHRHQGFKKADWAMPKKDLKRLEAVFKLLGPKGLEDRVRYLFRNGAGARRPGMDWRKQQDELAAAQADAARELAEGLSTDALFVFAETIDLRHALGFGLAKAELEPSLKRGLLKASLSSDADHIIEVGIGLLLGLKGHLGGAEGEALVQEVWAQAIAENWGEAAELRIVRALKVDAETWDQVEARSPSLSEAYWRSLDGYMIPKEADPAYVADRLKAAGRSRVALDWLGNNVESNPPAEVVIDIMKAAAASSPESGNDQVMFSYFVGKLLEYLDMIPDMPADEIVGLEWVYYQALSDSERPPRALHKALARSPEFFVELIKLVYLPASDSGVVEPAPDDPERATNMATQAWRVLHDWSHIPGADDAGVIDGAVLEEWVKRARKALAECGRDEVGDMKIGEALSAARRVPDEPWPPEPVREIIEVVRSRRLERGFEMGVYNRRGVTIRMPQDGGEQERALAQTYRRDADALRFDWPRTAACLDRLAASYDADAVSHDVSAEQTDWL